MKLGSLLLIATAVVLAGSAAAQFSAPTAHE
jgi:hypothetical protein